MSAERSEARGLVPSKTTPADSGTLLPFGSELSRRARIMRMRKTIWNAAQWLTRAKRMRVWFVTLTYRTTDQWRPMHVARFLDKLREWCRDRGAPTRYAWVAELQARGAVHYHVAVWLPAALALPFPDKAGWWPHGMTNRELAIAPVGYLMKYVSKGDTPMHQFPKGARIYGIGGLPQEGRAIGAWLNLPEWAKRLHGVGELCRRAGRLVVRASGEVLDSPWCLDRVPGGLLLRLTRELPERFHGGPYSAWPCRIEVTA